MEQNAAPALGSNDRPVSVSGGLFLALRKPVQLYKNVLQPTNSCDLHVCQIATPAVWPNAFPIVYVRFCKVFYQCN